MSASASADAIDMESPRDIAPQIARCNRLCRMSGLVILLMATVIVDRRGPMFGDFVQFYMTGLIDRAGAWDALYPIPIPGSVHNAGNWRDATTKPATTRLADLHGVDFIAFHFILPPPMAILFWPLGSVDGHTARELWILLSVVAGWLTAVTAGLILQRCAGRPTRWAGFMTLLVSALPAMRRAVLVANLSPMISAMIGWAILSLMNPEQDLEAAAAIVLGTFTKYASAVLMPIALIQRRWRMVGWSVVITIVWCLITMAIMGPQAFTRIVIEFATVIAPTLGRSHEMTDNICLTGVVLHALNRPLPLPAAIVLGIALLRIIVLGAILLPMIRLGRDRMREPAVVCCSAMSLMAWLLIFSPVAWSHYLLYLFPLWGWLAWPEGKTRWQIALSWIAMGLVIFSPDQNPTPAIDPWGLHLLLSLGMMLGLGMSELYRLMPAKYSERPRIQGRFEWTGRLSDQSAAPV